MKIQFIGTGSGKTSLLRAHSSFIISEKKNHILVDCGDGISRALLLQDVDFLSIDSIIISHLHPDHYSGLPLLLSQMKMNGRKAELKIFVHTSLEKFLKSFLRQSYIFNERMGYEISFRGFDHHQPFSICEKINCISKPNTHLDKYRSSDPKNELSFESSGFLFTSNSTSIFYTGDVGSADDLSLFDDPDYDHLVTETTHISIPDLISFIEKREITKVFLTHIGDEVEDELRLILKQLPANLKSKIVLAFDGMVTEI